MSDLCVQDHTVVAISYTLKDDKEHILDLASPDAPLLYIHGRGFLLPAVEAATLGKRKKTRILLTLEPDQAYGDFEPRQVQEVPREVLGEDRELHVGMFFTMEVPGGGGSKTFVLRSIEDDVVKLDGNHPLAGQRLHFDLTVEYVRYMTPEEREAGRALPEKPVPRRN